MSVTPVVGTTEMAESQASKYVTFNAAIRRLEICFGMVKSITTAAEPGSPAEGDAYVLPASPTGTNWASYAQNDLVYYSGGGWIVTTPSTTNFFRVMVADDSYKTIYWSGTAWVSDTASTTFDGDVTFADGADIILGSTTGTMIGTAVTQKLGFWGSTPIVQPASANQAVVTLGNTDGEIGGLTFSTPAVFNSVDGEIEGVTFSTPAVFNSVDGEIGGLTISATYSDTEVIALRDATEELGDDCRALRDTVNTISGTELLTLRTALEELGDDCRALRTTVNTNMATEVIALRDKSEELADDVRNLSVLLHEIRTALVNTGIIKGAA